MIHLFKKVYISTDNLIDLEFDRVVISAEAGFPMLQALERHVQGVLLAYGQNFEELIGEGKQFVTWIDFFRYLDEKVTASNKKLLIYCDNQSLLKILIVWFRTILSNSTKTSIESLIKSLIFRYNVFYKGRYSLNNGRSDITYNIEYSNFSEIYDSVQTNVDNSFVEDFKDYVGVEFLLASYLYNGSRKEELKNSIKVLAKKGLEKFLYELKEVFYAHLTKSQFTNLLNLNQIYNFDNFTDILSDGSTFVDLFTNSRLWNYKFISQPSSLAENINLTAITDIDISNFEEFTRISNNCWTNEAIYEYMHSEVQKLRFVRIFTDFTDDLLNQLIDVESSNAHEASSFFSIDLITVNNYLITALLEAKTNNNLSFIQKYTV